jgi:hypothetical protein
MAQGHFRWERKDFTQSALHIELRDSKEDPKLVADLPDGRGVYTFDEGIRLSRGIRNRDGNLEFLVSFSLALMVFGIKSIQYSRRRIGFG